MRAYLKNFLIAMGTAAVIFVCRSAGVLEDTGPKPLSPAAQEIKESLTKAGWKLVNLTGNANPVGEMVRREGVAVSPGVFWATVYKLEQGSSGNVANTSNISGYFTWNDLYQLNKDLPELMKQLRHQTLVGLMEEVKKDDKVKVVDVKEKTAPMDNPAGPDKTDKTEKKEGKADNAVMQAPASNVPVMVAAQIAHPYGFNVATPVVVPVATFPWSGNNLRVSQRAANGTTDPGHVEMVNLPRDHYGVIKGVVSEGRVMPHQSNLAEGKAIVSVGVNSRLSLSRAMPLAETKD
jgi:hypothetical protein